MFELFTSNLKLFRGETSGTRGDRWAVGGNVVCDIVFDRSVMVVVDPSEFGKLRE